MIKNEVLIQSPTRIDFAGGTLDCWPINTILGKVCTVNAAINIYTTCRLSVRDDTRILIHSRDLDLSFEFADLNEALACKDEKFDFFREHISYWMPNFGFNLSSQSDSPIGGGLGGSSSLSVSIFKAFSEIQDKQWTEHDLIRACSGIEAKILKKPTGTQDYFPAVLGGINIIDYNYGIPRVSRIDIDDVDINGNIALFYTGRSHHSGLNNWEVIKSFVEDNRSVHKALLEIQDIAECTKEVMFKKNWESLPQLFSQEYQARIQLTEHFTSPEIEKISEVAIEAGADAVNICGAGGGGCVFTWSSKDKRDEIIEACEDAGFTHLDIQLV